MATTKEVVPKTTLLKARQEGLGLITQHRSALDKLVSHETVLTTNKDYEEAARILGLVMEAQTAWDNKINPILAPLNAARSLLIELKNEIRNPLEDYETAIKRKMKDFKIEERRQLAVAAEAKRLEVAKLKEQEVKKDLASVNARTNAMRQKLIQARAELQQKIAEVQSTPTVGVKAAEAGTRNKKKWRVNSLRDLINHVSEAGGELDNLITIDEVQMNALFRLNRDKLKDGDNLLPGVEVYEDIDITGRRK